MRHRHKPSQRGADKPAGAARRALSRTTKDKMSPPKKPRYWSQRVTQTSNAMDLEPGVFKLHSSRAVAASLKRSAEASKRLKSRPFQAAMSMLNFYINRAGKNLPEKQKQVLQKAKDDLRKLFGKAG